MNSPQQDSGNTPKHLKPASREQTEALVGNSLQNANPEVSEQRDWREYENEQAQIVGKPLPHQTIPSSDPLPTNPCTDGCHTWIDGKGVCRCGGSHNIQCSTKCDHPETIDGTHDEPLPTNTSEPDPLSSLASVSGPSRVTRFEVIDHREKGGGRVLVEDDVDVLLSYQDDGRTLKVFLQDRVTQALSSASGSKPAKEPAAKLKTCPVCSGAGEITYDQPDYDSFLGTPVPQSIEPSQSQNPEPEPKSEIEHILGVFSINLRRGYQSVEGYEIPKVFDGAIEEITALIDKAVAEARLDEVVWYSNRVHITKKVTWDKYEVMRKNQIRAELEGKS